MRPRRGARGALDEPEALAEAMRETVDAAPRARRLELIRAHPQLAVAGPMAEASVREQRGAGLDRCSPDELEAFQRLNAAYLVRFGHPFIIAVAGLSRADILAAFAARLENDAEAEFATALEQIHRIAGFRLAALFDPG
jgi:2-oxo-4-hydroxy-4-carboxy-5-ureidoimidazoline decarboxylase